jgi:hypothetical protein
MLVVVHSGQTGVERGAHRAAVSAGLAVAGFMPVDKRDELGPIPDDIASWLTPCFDKGPRPAVRANVAIASGIVLVVPDAGDPSKFTAMSAVLTAARTAKLPYLVVDPLTNLDDVARWVQMLQPSSGSRRVLITGPRGTRWHTGEQVARRLVAAMSIAIDP